VDIAKDSQAWCCYRIGLDFGWRDILFVEATSMRGPGKLNLTGQLGDVMKESAEAALS
jgi:ATP-dependent Lon protease